MPFVIVTMIHATTDFHDFPSCPIYCQIPHLLIPEAMRGGQQQTQDNLESWGVHHIDEHVSDSKFGHFFLSQYFLERTHKYLTADSYEKFYFLCME